MDNMVQYIAVLLFAVVAVLPGCRGNHHDAISYTALCEGLEDVTADYRAVLDDFTVTTYKRGIALNSFHLVYAPTAMWLTLAAIAEGADVQTKHDLFKFLQLASDPCLRQAYYKLATNQILPGSDIRIANTRYLVINEGLNISPDWLQYVSRNSLLNVISAPIKSNPEKALKEMRQLIGAKLPKLNLDGNSVLLDAMDFSGLWTTAFPDTNVERAPFYDSNGQKLGYVDLMKIRRHAKMGYIPNIKAKFIQMPVGIDSRYYFIFSIADADGDAQSIVQSLNGSIIKEELNSLRESAIPLEIAIPQFTMSSELDGRAVLEDLGINNLWNDSATTRFISEPAAFPSGYVQRVTMSFHSSGAFPAPFVPEPAADTPTGLDPGAGRDFIANRPFMFGLFDAQTDTVLMASAFSRPTYPL